MSGQRELVVVGAGLVGLATARAYLDLDPDARVTVVEKERRTAVHQSGRNSGVIHAGLYYVPGSLKSVLCREGRENLLEFAEARDIPYQITGKLVVALDRDEAPRLEELAHRGRANGIVGIRELDRDELREIEPNVVGARALHVPETGVIDFAQVASALADDVRARGAEILLGRKVIGIERRGRNQVVRLRGGDDLPTGAVAVCAGVQSDRLLRLTGSDDGRYRIAPFRGDYYVLSPEAAPLVHALIYPVPDPSLPFLGVHFTRRIDGQVWAGPNAVPSLHREGYGRLSFRARDALELVAYPGMWRLARRYARAGATEIWRDLVKSAAVAQMRRYVPALTSADVSYGPSGVRAQVIGRDGSLIDDFLLERRLNVFHVVNAPSPAATASLAIGKRIAQSIRGTA